MSEFDFDKDTVPDSSEKSEAVEAFEDFEITAADAVEEAEELVEDTDEVLEEAEEAAEETDEVLEETEEAAEEADEVLEEAEEAAEETDEVLEEAEEAAEETDEVLEEAEEAAGETDEVLEEAEEAAEETDELVEEADEAAEDDIEEAAAAYWLTDSNADDTDEDDAEEEAESADEADEEDDVDKDDYLDYDDEPRAKKTVSGKTAAITMLVTCLVTLVLIAGAFWIGVTMKKDLGVSVVSYSDRFNACDTKSFSVGQLMGIELVSMSDEDYTFSADDISDLKSGKTVNKFSGLVNIKADTRFGKIVSMDISFDPSLDEMDSPAGTYMVLFGNAISGLVDGIDTSDMAFVLAYNALAVNCYPAPKKGADVYEYDIDDIAVYADYSKMAETGNHSDVTVHIEHKNPDYIDTSKLDFSWLPIPSSSDDSAKKVQTSASDISPSDK